jgi:hypothetical protein
MDRPGTAVLSILHFRLDIEPAGKIALALTGGPGVKEFLGAEMSS